MVDKFSAQKKRSNIVKFVDLIFFIQAKPKILNIIHGKNFILPTQLGLY